MAIDLEIISTLEDMDLQSQILYVLWVGPRRGQITAEIADELFRPDSSVRDRLQAMRDEGLVESSVDAVPQHTLTDEGRRLARQVKRKLRAA